MAVFFWLLVTLGGLMIAGANYLALQWAPGLPALHIPGFLHGMIGDIADLHRHEAWRYTVMSGLIPAIPLMLIRPFLPESPEWQRKRETGSLQRPSLAALFSPELRRTTILATLVFAASYGIAFGAIQQLPQILGGPKGHVQILATAKAAQPKRNVI